MSSLSRSTTESSCKSDSLTLKVQPAPLPFSYSYSTHMSSYLWNTRNQWTNLRAKTQKEKNGRAAIAPATWATSARNRILAGTMTTITKTISQSPQLNRKRCFLHFSYRNPPLLEQWLAFQRKERTIIVQLLWLADQSIPAHVVRLLLFQESIRLLFLPSKQFNSHTNHIC